MMQRTLLIALGIVSGLVVAAAILLIGGSAPDDGVDRLLLDEPWTAPEVHLRDLQGTRRRLRDAGEGHLAVFFGYTHCPDVCPITLAHLAREQQRLQAEGARLTLVFVTVDPQRDTPERLRSWTGAFGVPVVPLTGSIDEVRAAAWAWGIGVHYRDAATGAVTDTPPSTRGYLVDHTARTFIVDPRGRVLAQLPPDVTGEELGRLLDEVLQ